MKTQTQAELQFSLRKNTNVFLCPLCLHLSLRFRFLRHVEFTNCCKNAGAEFGVYSHFSPLTFALSKQGLYCAGVKHGSYPLVKHGTGNSWE